MMLPHTRREFLKTAAGLATGALGSQAIAGSTGPARPNVLLISIDTLRADRLSCLGYGRKTTPNLDRLAADGVVFSNATAASPWTVPSHMSMFTGLYPSFHGLLSTRMCMAEGITTLAEVLKANGYTTAAYVTGPMLNAKFGFGKGFEFYDDFSVTFQHKFDIFDEGVPEHTGINDLVTSPIVTRLVSGWLEGQGEVPPSVAPKGGDGERRGGRREMAGRGRKPFFLFVHYWDCHYDYIPPKPYDTMFDSGYQGIIDGKNIAWRTDIAPGMDQADLDHILALYDGEVRLTDEHVGRILRELKDLSLYDDTLIIVTSDHGEEFLEHGATKHGHTLFQELVHVPLIVKEGARSGKRAASVVTSQPVSHVDIMPTVLGCAGIEYDGPMHGTNLLHQASDRAVLFGAASRRDLRGMRQGDRKLIVDMDRHEASLFDLAEDPAEQKPVAVCKCDGHDALPAQAPPNARELAASLAEWHARGREFAQKTYGTRPKTVLKLRPEVRQQLKALGYVR